MTTSPTLERPPTETTPPPRPTRGIVLTGALAITIGGLWLLAALDIVEVRFAVVVPAILAAIGVALIIGALQGHANTGLTVLGIFVTLMMLAVAVTPPDAFEGGIGQRQIRVTEQVELADNYYLGVGDMVLDFSDLTLDESAAVTASVGAGEMRVLLPAGIPVDIEAVAHVGQVDLLGERSDGLGASRTYTSDGFDTGPVTLTLDLNVTAGNIEVER